MTTLLSESVPRRLTELVQWVGWQKRDREGKPTKLPINPITGETARVDLSATWGSFEQACQAFEQHGVDGIGFVFSEGDPYCGIDLDGCRNPLTWVIEPWASDIIDTLESYTEVSPSGTGVHIIVEATLPPGGNRKGGVEMYDRRRFFTFTGQHIRGTPDTIEERQRQLSGLHKYLFGGQQKPVGAVPSRGDSGPVLADDQQLVDRAMKATYGDKFSDLWRGDITAYGNDHSRADLALCTSLSFWTGHDRQRIDRLFRLSGLFRPKWDERRGVRTYGEMTVEKALQNTRDVLPFTPIVAPLDVGQRLAWPDPPEDAAYHGLAGDVVRAIEPHSEADPTALLFQFLTAVGSMIGRDAHFVAEADRHYANLFIVLVGVSSKGRKGSSWGHVRRLLEAIDPDWVSRRITGGLSTGEGLIHQVRDPIEERRAVKDNGRVIDYETIEADPGEPDKRTLIVEPEFGRVLQVAIREANTLSAILRDAWDSNALRVLTKNNRLTATAPHISLIGHVTKDELRRLLTDTMAANGYGNRHLWILTKRSKQLPEGGNFDLVDTRPIIAGIARVKAFAKGLGRLDRDEEARTLWREIYGELSEGKPGLLGALTGRAEAQVMRLALIYAVLDCSPAIKAVHLQAALACWGYCFASARLIFGNSLGDPTADDILAALQQHPGGMSRTALRDLFRRNKPALEISRALSLLAEYGLARQVADTGGQGRPAERWRAVQPLSGGTT